MIKERKGKLTIDLHSICFDSPSDSTITIDFNDLSPDLSSLFKLSFVYQKETEYTLKADSRDESEF